MIKKLIVLTLIVFLMGCAAYHPRIGMTYDDWISNKNSSWEYCDMKPKLVGATGNKEIWTLTRDGMDNGVYYYFKYGQLVEINQGRTQLEIINR